MHGRNPVTLTEFDSLDVAERERKLGVDHCPGRLSQGSTAGKKMSGQWLIGTTSALDHGTSF